MWNLKDILFDIFKKYIKELYLRNVLSNVFDWYHRCNLLNIAEVPFPSGNK